MIVALARPAHATEPPIDVTVLLRDDKGKPARGFDVLRCDEASGGKCDAVATTGTDGRATFKAAPRRTVTFLLLNSCGPWRWKADLRAVDPKQPIELQMEATSNLRVRALETLPGDKTKPIQTTKVAISIFPRPSLPNGAGKRTFQLQGRSVGYYDICIPPDTGWDVQVEIDGYYLGSTHVDAVKPAKTAEASVVVRAKPKP